MHALRCARRPRSAPTELRGPLGPSPPGHPSRPGPAWPALATEPGGRTGWLAGGRLCGWGTADPLERPIQPRRRRHRQPSPALPSRRLVSAARHPWLAKRRAPSCSKRRAPSCSKRRAPSCSKRRPCPPRGPGPPSSRPSAVAHAAAMRANALADQTPSLPHLFPPLPLRPPLPPSCAPTRGPNQNRLARAHARLQQYTGRARTGPQPHAHALRTVAPHGRAADKPLREETGAPKGLSFPEKPHSENPLQTNKRCAP